MKILYYIKRTFDVVFVVALVFVVVELVLIADAVINDKTPSLLGYTIYRMTSTSMEPVIHENDVILSKIVDEETVFHKGDIVTIKREGEKDSITHTIVKEPYKNHGVMMIETKGVANKESDPPVYVKDVESKFVQKLTFFDSFYEVLLSPLGISLFASLLIYMAVDELYVRYKAKKQKVDNQS